MITETSSSSYKDLKEFRIQAFGLDEDGNTYSVTIEDMEPFFFVKVNDKWKDSHIEGFNNWLIDKIGKYYKESVTVENKLQYHHKLYGLMPEKHRFLKITCASLMALIKLKNFGMISNIKIRC